MTKAEQAREMGVFLSKHSDLSRPGDHGRCFFAACQPGVDDYGWSEKWEPCTCSHQQTQHSHIHPHDCYYEDCPCYHFKVALSPQFKDRLDNILTSSDVLLKWVQLRDQGVITSDEFVQQKSRIIGTS